MRIRIGVVAVATGWALAASLLAPAASAAASADGQWRDPYVSAPRTIVAAAIDSCRYQVSFTRDAGDSRYVYGYDAEFRTASGSVVTRALAPETGTGIQWPQAQLGGDALAYYVLGSDESLAPSQVNVCTVARTGETLQGFRLRTTLGGGYDYTNTYRSPLIAPTTPGGVPTAPKIVSSTRVAGTDQLTLTWTASTGGNGVRYRVIADRPLYFGGDLEWDMRITPFDATGTSTTVPLGTYRPELARQFTVVAIGANGLTSDLAAATVITV